MTDNYAAVMNIEYGILVFVNRTLDDCCQQGFIIPANILVFKLQCLLLSTEIKMYICITLLSRKKVINSSRIHININNIYFLTLMPVVKNCFKFFVSHTTAII